jgi:glyoxylase-like metal-dependent hydrolase (beta-lactamase superfamily II)
MQVHSLTPDLGYIRILMVNVYFYGRPGAADREWVLIDAGLPGSARLIAGAAAARFGEGSRPRAIILTHGHFDHVGALESLADRWDAPVYAHERELRFLTGRASYPPPDPSVGGGALAALSVVYPRGPIDLGDRVSPLPGDGSVPGMPGWRWIETPGHTTGHVSLFREQDRTLIAGDAFTTTKQESALAVLTQRIEMHGPPAYFTPDWPDARGSVERLAALEPELAATGHGRPLRGAEMRRELHAMADNFRKREVPEHGRYVGRPPRVDPLSKLAVGMGAVVLAGVAWRRLGRRSESP